MQGAGKEDLLSHMNKIFTSSEEHTSGSLNQFDAQNALYSMILQNLLASFREACEHDVIGDVAFNALEHAIGQANDASIKAHDQQAVDWQGGVVIMWAEICDFIKHGSRDSFARRVPQMWFHHMLTVGEMLFVTCKALSHLGAATFMQVS
eukprot:SAG22_NODE_925_length_6469_cov_3.836264_3_plen_150_part_00